MYMVLAVVVLGLVGSIFINGLRAESIVRSSTQSTTAGQLALESIQRGVRNSVELDLFSPDGKPDDLVLKVRTAGAGDLLKYSCQGWYYSASDRSIRTTQADDGRALPVDVPLSWLLLAEDVDPGPSGKVFQLAGSDVTIDFTFSAANREPINIFGSATSRASLMEASTCV